MVQDFEPYDFRDLTSNVQKAFQRQRNTPSRCHDCSLDSESAHLSQLEDEDTRFLLWAGNLGALQDSDETDALDDHLRDAPEIALHICDILEEIRDLLQAGRSNNEKQNHERKSAEQPLQVGDQSWRTLPSPEPEAPETAQTSCFLDALRDGVSRLFRASELLSRSNVVDRYVKAEADCSLQAFEYEDIESIQEKIRAACGSAPTWLINRLGKANTKRRQFLAYSRASYNDPDGSAAEIKLATGNSATVPTERPGSATGSANGLKSQFASTKSTVTGYDDQNALKQDVDDAQSYTTDQTSLGDDELFIGLEVPSIENFANIGEMFICPLCCLIQKFNKQSRWRRHALADLRSYICTSQECGMLMFESFESWQSHEMDRHRRQWACQLCGVACEDRADTRAHLLRFHGDIVGEEHIDIILQASSSVAEHLMAKDCPFCTLGVILRKNNSLPEDRELVVPCKKFMKHLGRHLEEFTLLMYPRPELNEKTGDKGAETVAAHTGCGEDDKSCSAPSNIIPPSAEVSDEDTINASHSADPNPFESLVARLPSLGQDYTSVSATKENLTIDHDPMKNQREDYPVTTTTLRSLPYLRQQDDWPPMPIDHENTPMSLSATNIHPFGAAFDSEHTSRNEPSLLGAPTEISDPPSLTFTEVSTESRRSGRSLGSPSALGRLHVASDWDAWMKPPNFFSTNQDISNTGTNFGPYPPWDDTDPLVSIGLRYTNVLAAPQGQSMSYAWVPGPTPTKASVGAPGEEKFEKAVYDTPSAFAPVGLRFCHCGKDRESDMVRCSNVDCYTKWFHLGCTDLAQMPGDDENWICSTCRELQTSTQRIRMERGRTPQAQDGKFSCDVAPECAGLYFDRECEWSKHMDKHDHPYRCAQPQCANLQGFTYSGGLIRHERDVHSQHGGPLEVLRCTVVDCKRHTGKGFTRKANLAEHLRRVHGIMDVPEHGSQLQSLGLQPQIAENPAPGADLAETPASPYSEATHIATLKEEATSRGTVKGVHVVGDLL